MEDRVVLADRVHRLAAPPWRVYDALVSERDRWWARYDWEIAPVVVSAQATRVVWSSPWPVSPQDTIEFDLAPDADGTALRFVWRSESPPDERGVNLVRYRLNRAFGGDLRYWVDGGIEVEPARRGWRRRWLHGRDT